MIEAEQLRARIGNPRLRQLLDDWHALRADRALPTRSDFPPERLRPLLGPLLSDVTLFDVLGPAPYRYRYRLVGTNVVQWRGLKLTGTMLDAHPDRTFARFVAATCDEAVETRQPVWREVDVQGDTRRFRHEVLLLPLTSEGAGVDLLMGVTAPLADADAGAD